MIISHDILEIWIMQLPFEHVTCGIYQIFHQGDSGECVQVTGLSEC